MSFPIALPPSAPPPTPAQVTGAKIHAIFTRTTSQLQNDLRQMIQAVTTNPGHTAQEFWTEQGTNGGAVLGAFGSAVSFLLAIDPSKVIPEIANAADNLTVAPDGTVTVTT